MFPLGSCPIPSVPNDAANWSILRASLSAVCSDRCGCGPELAVSVWEHTFLTAQPHAHVRFRRAIERRALWMAEDAARELPNLSLEEALQLVQLYAEQGSPKFEPAARRWLVRYLTEGTPSLRDVAKVTVGLAKPD
jgi:hypothetical protein